MKDQEPTVPSESDRPSKAEAPTLAESPGGDAHINQHSGDSIGNYKLLKLLGEGGMGEVWLAEQLKPIRRRVALKIIKQGMDTRQVVSRFESERQVLAILDHPNIAKVLDAGSTQRGRPYFVMEYVEGVTITEYCDTHQLTTRKRLELFFKVCEGIQYAHRNAIIHRDIKPGNVLVTIQDSQPVPKIIDFGVAKATDLQLTERSVFTEVGQLIGTPEYMSPEQAEMSALGVDTRTDIYSLGVLLYVLLVGILPFDHKELRAAGYDEIRRRIREDEPARPSKRLSTLGLDLPSLAKARGTNPTKLSHELRGDLDWIVMKAMDKDRTRRYDTPTELAADLQRHLLNEPVMASPPSAIYRTKKFVRRHTLGVAFATVVLGLIVTQATTMTIQAGRIARERDRANQEAVMAEQVSEFMVGLFETSEPNRALGETITAREILEKGAASIQKELTDQPVVQAKLLRTIGRVYTELGLYEEARPLLNQALRIDERVSDEYTVSTTLLSMAMLAAWLGEYNESEEYARRAIDLRENSQDPENLDVAEGLNALGNALQNQGRLQEALPVHQRALAIRKNIPGADGEIGVSLHNLAIVHYFLGEYEEAEKYYLDAAEIERQIHGPESPSYATTLHTLAVVYKDQGKFEEALELEKKATAIREKTLGPDHLHLAFSLCTLGNIHRLSGDPSGAVPLQQRALNIALDSVGSDHGETTWMRESLALTLDDLGSHQEAEKLLRESIAYLERDGDREWLVEELGYLVSNLRRQGRNVEAAEVAARATELTK